MEPMTYLAANRTYIAVIGPLLIAAAMLASCATKPADAPAAEAAPAEAAPQPLTQQEASEQCWMETEHGAKSLPLDKRAKVVDKCIKDTMSGAK
jgi:hypothetical protein